MKVTAGITTSLDGYITGPSDRPGRGLGDGGERLHYWVFGGPWSYEEEPRGEPTGANKDFLDAAKIRGDCRSLWLHTAPRTSLQTPDSRSRMGWRRPLPEHGRQPGTGTCL